MSANGSLNHQDMKCTVVYHFYEAVLPGFPLGSVEVVCSLTILLKKGMDVFQVLPIFGCLSS